MESKKSLEPGLVSILNGVDLSKLIPLFEKYSINLELFFSFTDEDLIAIGVESSNERDLILNIRNKLRQNNQNDELSTRPEEILEIVKNSQNQVHAIDVGAFVVFSKFKKDTVVDFLIDGDKPITSAIEMFCNRLEKQSDELIYQIDEIIENLMPNKNQEVSRNNILRGLSCATVIILISVFGFLKYKNN